MKIEGKDIIKNIENHSLAYQCLKLEIPIYRITDIEYMVLENYLMWNFPESFKSVAGKIKYFMNVELEIVKKGDF
jgi:hypothetical protein